MTAETHDGALIGGSADLGCIPCGLPRPLLLALMRAIARTTAWREHRNQLIRTVADDAWEVDGVWIMAFGLRPPVDAVLVFELVVDESVQKPQVRSAVVVTRDEADQCRVIHAAD